jgi:hypothetical protein
MEENKWRSQPPSQNPLQPVLDLLQGGSSEDICRTYGITREELEKRLEAYQTSRRQLVMAEQVSSKKAGRNDPCPCGSGKKFKKCCLLKHEEARQNLPQEQLREFEERTKAREKLEEDVRKGFDLLFSQDFPKAQRLARSLLKFYPEDDRLHDILVTSLLAAGDYDEAFFSCRQRWQVAIQERDFFQEKGYHQREGSDRKQLVHFYPPSTWLEKFWIAQRARAYREIFPTVAGSPLAKVAKELLAANDVQRFPSRQEDGYQIRKQGLAPVLERLERTGPEAIPYLLPLVYSFSWASLLIPDLLRAYGTDDSLKLLAELSMFRFPYFAQECLTNLESFGERAVAVIASVLHENSAFDELKGGLIKVLGNIPIPASLAILERLVDHQNIYVVKWVAEALERLEDPQSQPHLLRARERLASADSVAGVFPEVLGNLDR